MFRLLILIFFIGFCHALRLSATEKLENVRVISLSMKSNLNFGRIGISISDIDDNSIQLKKSTIGNGNNNSLIGSVLLKNSAGKNGVMIRLENEKYDIHQKKIAFSMNSNTPSDHLTVVSDQYKMKIASSQAFMSRIAITNQNEPNGCACVKGNCACCLEIDVPEFDHKVCVNATYNPQTIGLDLSIGVDGHFFTEEISIRNPPPVCFSLPIPGAEHIAGVCKAFTDLDLDRIGKKLRGCVEFEVELIHLRVIHFKIGCFVMPI